ncbi:hypothetical protein NJ76_10025 [Rhodococcus sp. IITR03]|nr:hypothetical protein NJ76_10025 [Rhodococcus sp. IITR03]
MSGSNGTDESPHEHDDARTENVGSTAESAREAEGASAPTERFEAVDPHREVTEAKASGVTEAKASSVTERRRMPRPRRLPRRSEPRTRSE